MEARTRLYLVRHGQTDLNRDRRFRGFTDAPLNEVGREEARAAGRLVAGAGVELIRTSPMPRAVETAEIVADEAGAPVVTDERLTDIDYGRWQGLTVEQVADEFGPGMIESWKSDPGGFTFPEGDSMRSVRDRLAPALPDIGRSHPGKGVALVTHMAILKVCFLVMLELDLRWFWKIGIDNGSVSLFTYSEGSGFVMEWWNRTP